MVMVGAASGSLQVDSQPRSFHLGWGSAAAWRRSTLGGCGLWNPMKMSDIEPNWTNLKIQKPKTRFLWFGFQITDFGSLGTVFTLSHSQFICQHDRINSQSIFKPPPPVGAGGGYMFSGRPCVRLCVRPSVIHVVVLCFCDISSICWRIFAKLLSLVHLVTQMTWLRFVVKFRVMWSEMFI